MVSASRASCSENGWLQRAGLLRGLMKLSPVPDQRGDKHHPPQRIRALELGAGFLFSAAGIHRVSEKGRGCGI